MSFIPQPFEDEILQNNRSTLLARAQADQIYQRGNWSQVADLLSQWGDQAPTLPPGNAVAFAHAGIAPSSPLGQQVISQVVPQQATLTSEPGRPQVDRSPLPYGTPPSRMQQIERSEANAPTPEQQNYVAPKKEGFLGQVAGGISGAVKSVAATAQHDVLDPVNRAFDKTTSLASGWTVQPDEVSQAGFGNTDDAKAVARTLGATANSLSQAVKVPLQVTGAAVSTARGNPEGEDVSMFGNQYHFGSLRQAVDPKQFQLYQQLTGKSLGSGILPGGPGAEAATAAQRAAGSIDGHTLTYGRGLASAVTTPGTRPYSIVSGITDFGVAQELDPTAALLKEYSTANDLARTFTATPDEAYLSTADHLLTNANTSEQVTKLREWTGATAETQPDLRQAIIDRLHTNPDVIPLTTGPDAITSQRGVLKAMATNALGASTFLRRHVDQPTAMSWLNGKRGDQFANDIADDPSFTSIWHKTNKQVPVNLVSALARSSSPEDVKFMLSSELGTTMDKAPGFGWLRPLEDVRLLHALPDAIDLTDRSQAVEQVERTLISANVPRAKWDAALQPVADATDNVDLEAALTGPVANIVKQHLVENYNVSPKHAGDLTRFFDTQAKTDRMYAVDQVGDAPHLPGITLDGESVPIVGPHQTNELLNRVIPNLDGRDLTQATTRWRAALHLWDNQGKVGGGLEGFSHFMDFITDTWKASVLLAPRIVVRYLADEQLGLAASGDDSMFSHPIRYLSWVTARKGGEDITGENFADQVHDVNSTISEALGQHITLANDPPGKLLLKHYTAYPKDSSMYNSSWADELSQIAHNPVSREVARAIRDPENYQPAGYEGDLHGLDAVKRSLWDGSLAPERERLARANLEWGSKYLDPQEAHEGTQGARAWSDAYVQSEADRVLTKTAGAPDRAAHPDLLNAVADGEPFRTPGKIDASFKRSLDGLQDFGPDYVKGRIAVSKGRVAGWDRAVEKMFSALMGTPTTTLTRSPAFRQAYWDKAQNMLPFMDQDAQAATLRAAAESGIELSPVTQAGDLGLEDADAILKAHSLAQVKKLIYYPGERVGVTDRLRNIAPFADAWRVVLRRWGSLAAANPAIIRRAQQGVTELQQSGVFHPDPSQGGAEVFTMIPSGIMRHLAGTPFPIVGGVSGLNIASQGLPGVGPAVQIGTAPLFSAIHNTTVDKLRDHLFPYGLPDTAGGLAETMFPGWLDKLRAGGLIQPVPFLREAPSQRESMTVSNLAKSIFSYKISAGTVNMHDVDSVQKGWASSTHEATVMYGWMGLAQFVAPAAPHLDTTVKLKNGNVVETYLLANDYSNMLKASNGDSDKATQQFIVKYGPERVFAIEPKAQRLIYGIDTGPEAQAWSHAHSAFAQKFPQVYGYWAPTTNPGQKGSYQDYLDGIKNGIYAPLSIEDWSHLAEARVGNVAYNQARQMVGPTPNPDQAVWLRDVKAKLTAQYPGFGLDFGTAKLNTPQKIAQVAQAVNNKDVPAGDLTTAARAYLEARNQALVEAKNRGLAGTSLGAKSVTDLRDWLMQVGTALATKYPSFTNMWNYIFQYEVDPNG